MTEDVDGRPTLDSVARLAQVSRQTVSNVLNAPHLVRPATLERVQAVIDRLGYRPHRAARTLRTRRSQLLAIRMHQPGAGGAGAILDSFLHALTTRAQQSDQRVMLFAADDDAGEIAAYDELITDHDVDAFVLTGTHLGDARTAWLTERKAAFVTFGRPWGTTATHAWVDVDGQAGMFTATEHLIAAGHRRIAFIGWPEGSGVGDDRAAGWRNACHQAGLSTDGLLRRVEGSWHRGRAAGAELLDLADPPTAIVCVADSIALGVWSELGARGLRPGPDVAVIGFDDSDAAQLVGLSSLAQPVDDVARTCVQLLNQVLAETAPKTSPPEPVLLAPRLVVRESSRSVG